MNLTLQPAYGRDYKSKAAVLADWNDNKDFRIASYGPDMGRYINKAEVSLVTDIVHELKFRYQQDRKVTVLKTERETHGGCMV